MRKLVGAVVARCEYQERGHDLSALGIVLADDRGLRHGGMLDQRRLHLEGADPVRR
jgi:hypothetical protein